MKGRRRRATRTLPAALIGTRVRLTIAAAASCYKMLQEKGLFEIEMCLSLLPSVLSFYLVKRGGARGANGEEEEATTRRYTATATHSLSSFLFSLSLMVMPMRANVCTHPLQK